MFLGAILIIIGAVITGTTITIMTKGSSWVVGFCWPLVCRLLPRPDPSTSSRHPIQPSGVLPRPTATPFWSTGLIFSSGAVRVGLNYDGNASW